ncbi:MAG: glycosyltransferase family 4 protein [Desulfomicrobium sp.]|nr:glycosyltransferase family 4 protein [Desulfomicrobium sp.]
MNPLTRFFDQVIARPWMSISRWGTTALLTQALTKDSHTPQFVPQAGTMLYVAASTLPYHISGYTNRTQAVIRALSQAGKTVYALTRPGYPWDRPDRLQDAQETATQVEEIKYHHFRTPRNNRPVLFYTFQAAKVIAQRAQEQKVALIHAASNHVNALPALVAARSLGLPFQYEMRGLWELTRIARQPWFKDLPAYRQGLELEGLVARHADRLLVISKELGEYMTIQAGVDGRRMALLPNCVHLDEFTPAHTHEVESMSIGFAGSLMGYEGLDTLILALRRLKDRGVFCTLYLIGDGEARSQLETLVRDLGLLAQVFFMGRVSPKTARQYLERVALICLPRKPYTVCHIVPPIKLVEALAMGKPVVVSDLPVFRSEAPHGTLFFTAGNDEHLAEVLDKALADQEALVALGQAGRNYVQKYRLWARFMSNLL